MAVQTFLWGFCKSREQFSEWWDRPLNLIWFWHCSLRKKRSQSYHSANKFHLRRYFKWQMEIIWSCSKLKLDLALIPSTWGATNQHYMTLWNMMRGKINKPVEYYLHFEWHGLEDDGIDRYSIRVLRQNGQWSIKLRSWAVTLPPAQSNFDIKSIKTELQ